MDYSILFTTLIVLGFCLFLPWWKRLSTTRYGAKIVAMIGVACMIAIYFI